MSISHQLSQFRLGGEPVPRDLEVLAEHAHELEDFTGIVIPFDSDWKPWLDTSYLKPEELINPDIAANIKAIEKVCSYIAFIAQDDEGAYLGYWRGPSWRKIADSPLVVLDNEGQFSLCAGSNFADAVVARHWDEHEARQWVQSLGLDPGPSFRLGRDIIGEVDPRELHWQLQAEYLAQQ